MIVSFVTDQKATRFFELSLRFLVGLMIATTSGIPPVSGVQNEEVNPNEPTIYTGNSMHGVAIPNGPMTRFRRITALNSRARLAAGIVSGVTDLPQAA
jgi:hypothetical protein